MANEQSGIPLRRWRPFYGAFVAIDEAIEAAGHPRAAVEDVRRRILQLLRAATDDGVAEQLCAALDDAMVEALETLRVVPAPHGALASADLAKAVGPLRKHGSARIRGLAGDVVRGLTTANVATATSVKKVVSTVEAKKMESTKRKLREGYDEAEKAKRQHTSKKIQDKDALKMFERSQRKMQRGPARCRVSSGVRRSLLPALQLI